MLELLVWWPIDSGRCAVPAGAMLSGLREAARAVQLLRGPAGAEAADLVASRTETLSKSDKRKRLEGGVTSAACALRF